MSFKAVVWALILLTKLHFITVQGNLKRSLNAYIYEAYQCILMK